MSSEKFVAAMSARNRSEFVTLSVAGRGAKRAAAKSKGPCLIPTFVVR